MKPSRIKPTAALVIPLLFICLWAAPVLGEDVVDSTKIVSFYEDVTWSEILAYAEYWQSNGVTVLEELPLFNTLIMKVPHGVSSRDLASDPRVETVEQDRKTITPQRVQSQSGSFIQPVDRLPHRHYPWGILRLYDQPYNPMNLTSRYRSARLPQEVKAAFNSAGTNRIRIAVFDTGAQFSHDSLYWSMKDGVNLLNAAVADQQSLPVGYNPPIDDNGHGTYVTGIITIALDRWGNWGLCGTPVDIYAVKILDHQAMGELSSIIKAFHWCINKQIHVVNMSIGFRDGSPAVRRAVKKADELGIVMVAAVGNHSNWDDNVILSADGGAADGGAADGGAADGGAADGGAADGGAADGGAADGGAADGGAADGGAADGGAADGGAADGGAADGGAADGGAADGGAADGGAADGGAADGGAADGGAADGGAADGGAADGGAADSSGDPLPPFSVMYPARYPQVIGVGALTRNGDVAPYNNTGKEVDILAPGSDIISADITNGDPYSGYGKCSGTSQAAAHITAAVALMLATDPSLTPEEIRQILIETSDTLGGAGNPGEIDLTEALQQIRMEMAYLDQYAWYWNWFRLFGW